MKNEVTRTPFNQQLLHLSPTSAAISATDEMFNHVDTGDYMWSGDGERRVEMSFIFKEVFTEPPVISVALAGMDSDQSANLRFHVAAENVTPTGFTAVFLTWDNTHIARASITWTAIGPIAPPAPARSASKAKA